MNVVMASLLAAYNYLNTNNPMVSLELIVWSIFVGIVIGAAASIYNKRVIGSFVRALIQGGATMPDSAMTVSETGFRRNLFVRMSLRRGGALRKLVYCANEPAEIPAEKVSALRRFFAFSNEFHEKLDMNAAKFYIPGDLTARAEIRYEKKGTDLFSLLITVLVFLVVVYISLKFIPELIGMLDSLITEIVPATDDNFLLLPLQLWKL